MFVITGGRYITYVHLLVGRARSSDVLRSCQVDEVQLPDLADLVAVEGTLVHVHGHGEDGVGSGRKIVTELHSTLFVHNFNAQ